jgi:hypothetical protein
MITRARKEAAVSALTNLPRSHRTREMPKGTLALTSSPSQLPGQETGTHIGTGRGKRQPPQVERSAGGL